MRYGLWLDRSADELITQFRRLGADARTSQAVGDGFVDVFKAIADKLEDLEARVAKIEEGE